MPSSTTTAKELYDGKVRAEFQEGAHRYKVSQYDELDAAGSTGWTHPEYKQSVTTIISKTLAKEALMLWPLDEAMRYLFGQTYQETTDGLRPTYNESKAFLQPSRVLSQIQLQEALEAARTAHTKKRDKGADVGSVTHAWIEAMLKGEESFESTNVPKEAHAAVFAFVHWYAMQAVKPLVVERIIYSKYYGYAGTMDILLDIGGKVVVADIKTSNASRTAPKGIYAENFIQLGGYSLAYQEETGQEIDDLLIINASKKGEINTCYASELDLGVDSCQGMFRDCLALYRAGEDLRKKLKEL